MAGARGVFLGSAMPVFDDGTETLDLDTVDESALWTLTCLPVVVVGDWAETWQSLCRLCWVVGLRGFALLCSLRSVEGGIHRLFRIRRRVEIEPFRGATSWKVSVSLCMISEWEERLSGSRRQFDGWLRLSS